MGMGAFFGGVFFKRGKQQPGPLLLLLVLLLAGCSSAPRGADGIGTKSSLNPSFTGLWVAAETDKTSFELDLTQVGTAIEGYHAALVGQAGLIEVALRTDPEPPSVRGRVSAVGRASVQFQLRKSSGSGEALLTIKGDRLKWQLISVSGAAQLPKKCVLYRQSGPAH